MEEKPRHLGEEYGNQWEAPSMAAQYDHRPPYPAEVLSVLATLCVPSLPRVLDLGAGTGDLARPLADNGLRVDAVDRSAAMVARGQARPGGTAPGLRWIVGMAETAPLEPPYGLVTAGECIHWLAWQTMLPRIHRALAPHGTLALVARAEVAAPWAATLQQVIARHSTNRDFRRYDILDELAGRKLFALAGIHRTVVHTYRPTVAEYVGLLHSRNGFSPARMASDARRACDEEVGAVLAPHARNGRLTCGLRAVIAWGRPAARI